MPEMPVLKKFPYETKVRCAICHPADSPEPPFMLCRTELKHVGMQVIRNLECPNCGSTDTDVFDLQLNSVTFNHQIDIQAARGVRRERGGDL